MNSLLVFVKHPIAGQVKTRLAKTLGDNQAVAVYQKLLTYTKIVVESIDAEKHIWYGNHIPKHDLWKNYARHEQPEGDLGIKMKTAFEQAFKTSQKVMVIGSDCPEISPDHLVKGFELLDNHDVVLGPASDGGYYLMGMKTLHPFLFTNIQWSTPQVLEKTLQMLEENQITYNLMEVLSDIDTEADLEKHKAFGPG